MMWKRIERFLKEEDGFLQFVAPIVGGLIGASASKSAAKTQANAARDAAGVQRDIYEQTRADLNPFRLGGLDAFDAAQSSLGDDFTQTPGYQFGLEQGLDAIEGSAAARGNLMSGATLQGLQSYAQDYASNQYQNWLGNQMRLGQMGQNAAAQQATQGQAYANNTGNYLTDAGRAGAAGTIGAANALAGPISDLTGYAANSIFNYQAPMTSPRPMPRPI